MKLDLSNTTEIKTRTKLRNIKRKLKKIIGDDIYSIHNTQLANKKGYMIQIQLIKKSEDDKPRIAIIPSWTNEDKLKEEIIFIANKIKNNEADVKEVVQNE